MKNKQKKTKHTLFVRTQMIYTMEVDAFNREHAYNLACKELQRNGVDVDIANIVDIEAIDIGQCTCDECMKH